MSVAPQTWLLFSVWLFLLESGKWMWQPVSSITRLILLPPLPITWECSVWETSIFRVTLLLWWAQKTGSGWNEDRQHFPMVVWYCMRKAPQTNMTIKKKTEYYTWWTTFIHCIYLHFFLKLYCFYGFPQVTYACIWHIQYSKVDCVPRQDNVSNISPQTTYKTHRNSNRHLRLN